VLTIYEVIRPWGGLPQTSAKPKNGLAQANARRLIRLRTFWGYFMELIGFFYLRSFGFNLWYGAAV
jgi:hypothetical protein